jgi:hypothetical protein
MDDNPDDMEIKKVGNQVLIMTKKLHAKHALIPLVY